MVAVEGYASRRATTIVGRFGNEDDAKWNEERSLCVQFSAASPARTAHESRTSRIRGHRTTLPEKLPAFRRKYCLYGRGHVLLLVDTCDSTTRQLLGHLVSSGSFASPSSGSYTDSAFYNKVPPCHRHWQLFVDSGAEHFPNSENGRHRDFSAPKVGSYWLDSETIVEGAVGSRIPAFDQPRPWRNLRFPHDLVQRD